jgi:hypothetical protein
MLRKHKTIAETQNLISKAKYAIMKNFLLLLFMTLSSPLFSQNKYASQWKLGVALWTFHSVPFSGELAMADSAGLKYVEGYGFGNAGP